MEGARYALAMLCTIRGSGSKAVALVFMPSLCSFSISAKLKIDRCAVRRCHFVLAVVRVRILTHVVPSLLLQPRGEEDTNQHCTLLLLPYIYWYYIPSIGYCRGKERAGSSERSTAFLHFNSLVGHAPRHEAEHPRHCRRRPTHLPSLPCCR